MPLWRVPQEGLWEMIKSEARRRSGAFRRNRSDKTPFGQSQGE